ncbi:MAG: putative metal-dependent hydrolase [Acidobacteriota bacterium]|nr:putative metal-dependent hydrolase [Acidobacteriota bacterium]
MSDAKDPRYPVGRFTAVLNPGKDVRAKSIADMSALPARLREAVAGLSDAQLDTPYRDGGWTVRQVVHHIADSHMNGLTRVKLALTEDSPAIKAYAEQLWAELPDSRLPIELSLRIIDGLHARLDAVVGGMSDEDFKRTFVHPANGLTVLESWVQLYAWHSRHHVGHVTELRRRMNW